MRRFITIGVILAATLGSVVSSSARASETATATTATTATARPILHCPSSTVCLYNSAAQNTEGLGCNPFTWVRSQLVEPIVYLVDNCRYRVWLHQDQSGGGWSKCISPFSAIGVATYAQNPGNLQVSSNTSGC